MGNYFSRDNKSKLRDPFESVEIKKKELIKTLFHSQGEPLDKKTAEAFFYYMKMGNRSMNDMLREARRFGETGQIKNWHNVLANKSAFPCIRYILNWFIHTNKISGEPHSLGQAIFTHFVTQKAPDISFLVMYQARCLNLSQRKKLNANTVLQNWGFMHLSWDRYTHSDTFSFFRKNQNNSDRYCCLFKIKVPLGYPFAVLPGFRPNEKEKTFVTPDFFQISNANGEFLLPPGTTMVIRNVLETTYEEEDLAITIFESELQMYNPSCLRQALFDIDKLDKASRKYYDIR